jgi:MoaA/NifB/PqqE/SkfB family radical SAM enzyme
MHSLLWSSTSGHATIEVTGFCDLRCLYCYQSDPTYRRRKPDPALLERIVDELCAMGIPHVLLAGEGEITTYKGWEGLALRLRDAGVHYSLISNFSHRYTPRQIDAMVGAAQITVSFDTYDPDLHAKIRRRSKLSTILENLTNIHIRSEELGIKPHITNNCVVSMQTLSGVAELAARAPNYGINRVALLSMIDGQKIKGEFEVEETYIDGMLRPGVTDAIRDFLATAEAVGVEYHVCDSIMSRLRSEEAMVPVAASLEEQPREAAPAGVEPQTRLCVKPWRAVYIRGDHHAGPCCLLPGLLGSLETRTIEDAVHSQTMRDLQNAMITGRLTGPDAPKGAETCAGCSIYRMGPISELQAMLAA